MEINRHPTFTIIVPTYNRCDLLPKTLDSILAQTYPSYEVVIVDNCSTDSTETVIQSYLKDQRFHYICNDRNRERAFSRNVGMANAKGQYVTFLDSDDLVRPEFLQDANEFLQHNDFKIFHNLYELQNSEGEFLYKYSFPSATMARQYIVEGNFLSCIGVFIAKEIYHKYRFETGLDLTGTEDWDFWLRVLADYDLGRINKVNAIIIDHAKRTVKNKDIAQSIWQKKQMVIDRVISDPHLSRIYGPMLRRMKSSSLLYASSLALANGDKKGALVFLLKCLGMDFNWIVRKRFLSVLFNLLTPLRITKSY